MKKRKLSVKKIVKFVIVLLIIVALIIVAIKFLTKEDTVKKVEVEDEIKEYGYKMDDNETEYYKSLFKELKTVLEKETVDENEYASLVSQLFLADFLNLDNKLSKNDVGGVQFIYTDFQSDFEKIAKEGIYDAVVNKETDAESETEMPEVTNVEVVDLEHITHNYLDQTDNDAIKVDLKITYKTDLDYQDTTSLILVHNGKKLEIVEMSED
mgnify:CR=1 FL=1